MDSPLVDALGRTTADTLRRQLDLRTVGDLLRHYPRRYVDNNLVDDGSGQEESEPREGAPELRVGEHLTLVGRIERVAGRRMARRRGHLTEVDVSSGAHRFAVTFFNQPWRERELSVGTRALFSGELARYRDRWQLTAPDLVVLGHEGGEARIPKLLPIYRATKKVRSWTVMYAVRQALDVLDDPLDPVPEEIRDRHGLPDLATALRDIHWSDGRATMHAARRRLVWDEAFGLQLALHARRASATSRPAPACPLPEDGLRAAFDRRLPFTLTDGQREVGESLATALERTEPLNRLLQGDVGSGKTLVALRAMLQVVDAGRQAVLLAPTEVLAAQHARSLRGLLGPLARAGQLDLADAAAGDAAGPATTVTLLTGSLSTAERRQALLELQSGAAGIVVGTHAVLGDQVGYADLGLVVVDEQHRFGVHQRDELRSRPGAVTPHLLVMTATPIPRTVAMTLYGDLDTSVLGELPAGRSPVRTSAVSVTEHPSWLARVWQRVHEEAAAGHQVYLVCPRIGEGEPSEDEESGPAEPPPPRGPNLDAPDAPDAPDADGPDVDGSDAGGSDAGEGAGDGARPPVGVLEVAPRLAAGALGGLRMEILHGRLPGEEKDRVMRRFADGEVDVLVATTVIEVGVDVPNATLIVILDAERFGVSQLHQLRGRVGRGAAGGACLLVTEAAAGSDALARLDALARTGDGFAVAELDLRSRREGDVLGAEQSGKRSGLQLLSVLTHGEQVAEAREAARRVVEADPTFAEHPRLAGLVRSVVSEEAAAFLDRL